jgi:hypothetical protein
MRSLWKGAERRKVELQKILSRKTPKPSKPRRLEKLQRRTCKEDLQGGHARISLQERCRWHQCWGHCGKEQRKTSQVEKSTQQMGMMSRQKIHAMPDKSKNGLSKIVPRKSEADKINFEVTVESSRGKRACGSWLWFVVYIIVRIILIYHIFY